MQRKSQIRLRFRDNPSFMAFSSNAVGYRTSTPTTPTCWRLFFLSPRRPASIAPSETNQCVTNLINARTKLAYIEQNKSGPLDVALGHIGHNWNTISVAPKSTVHPGDLWPMGINALRPDWRQFSVPAGRSMQHVGVLKGLVFRVISTHAILLTVITMVSLCRLLLGIMTSII